MITKVLRKIGMLSTGSSKLSAAICTRTSGSGSEQDKGHKYNSFKYAAALTGGAATAYFLYTYSEDGNKSTQFHLLKTTKAKELPVYSSRDISCHSTRDTGIWVSYKDGVYDISEFVDSHPGGDKILLAAGGPIDPFWNMYQVHKNDEVLEILEQYKIGLLDVSDQQPVDLSDPFASEPVRLPLFRVNASKPFNAEPPPKVITDSFITPNEIFYVRNHLPVPEIDPADYTLEVMVGEKTVRLSLDELKTKFTPTTITTTIQCAGNRREEMSKHRTVKGLSWGLCAISTARWTGARLKDVLTAAGLERGNQEVKHIHLNGLDVDLTKSSYGASIPTQKAMADDGDVLIAYQMNGVDIPRDHGYPVRAIVPGCVGARNVKWLHQVVASDVESDSHWQKNDYKGFSPSTTFETADYSKAQSIQELPIVSAITVPGEGDLVDADVDGTIEVKGYAWSGGGRDVIRVEVSADGGATWQEAKMEKNPEQDDSSHNWAWSLWSAEVPVACGETTHLVCRAIDSSFNCQPENPESIWNLRGFMMNAWHRVDVTICDE